MSYVAVAIPISYSYVSKKEVARECNYIRSRTIVAIFDVVAGS